MCKASLILSWKDTEAVSRIEKQSSEHKAVHVSDLFMCWKMCEFLSDVKCSRTRVIPAAFFDQIFPWSFWSIDQLDRLFHICLEFCHVVPVVLRCVVLRCVVLRLAVCCVVRLCCIALRCVAICCVLCEAVVLCCVALCCCHALYLFCFDVVFSSLSLRCVFPVVLRFLSCLLLLLRLALCCSCLVFGMVLLALFCLFTGCVVLCWFPCVALRCVALRCVALCSVGIFCRRCVALRCVLFCDVVCRCVVFGCCAAFDCVLFVALRCGVVFLTSHA